MLLSGAPGMQCLALWERFKQRYTASMKMHLVRPWPETKHKNKQKGGPRARPPRRTDITPPARPRSDRSRTRRGPMVQHRAPRFLFYSSRSLDQDHCGYGKGTWRTRTPSSTLLGLCYRNHQLVQPRRRWGGVGCVRRLYLHGFSPLILIRKVDLQTQKQDEVVPTIWKKFCCVCVCGIGGRLGVGGHVGSGDLWAASRRAQSFHASSASYLRGSPLVKLLRDRFVRWPCSNIRYRMWHRSGGMLVSEEEPPPEDDAASCGIMGNSGAIARADVVPGCANSMSCRGEPQNQRR